MRAEGKNQEAYDLFQQAARLDPANTEYLTTREVARQQLVFDRLQQGNQQMLAGKQTQALAAFRSALIACRTAARSRLNTAPVSA